MIQIHLFLIKICYTKLNGGFFMRKFLPIFLFLLFLGGCTTSSNKQFLNKQNPTILTTKNNIDKCSKIQFCHMVDLSAISSNMSVKELVKTKYGYILLTTDDISPTSLIVVFLTRNIITDEWSYESYQTYPDLIDINSKISIIVDNYVTIFITNNSGTTTLSYELRGNFIEQKYSSSLIDDIEYSLHIGEIFPLEDSFLAIASSTSDTVITEENRPYLIKYNLENEVVWKASIKAGMNSDEMLYNPTIQLVNNNTFLLVGNKYKKLENQEYALLDNNLYYAIYNTDGILKKSGIIPLDNQNNLTVISSITPSNLIQIQSDNHLIEFDPITDTVISDFLIDDRNPHLFLNNSFITTHSKNSEIIITKTNRNESTIENYDFKNSSSTQLFYSNERLITTFFDNGSLFMINEEFELPNTYTTTYEDEILQLNNLIISCKDNSICHPFIDKEVYELIGLSIEEYEGTLHSSGIIRYTTQLNNGNFLMIVQSDGEPDNRYVGTDCGCPANIYVILLDSNWNYIRHDYYPNMVEFYSQLYLFKHNNTIYLSGETQFQNLTVLYDFNGNLIKKEQKFILTFEENSYTFSTNILSYGGFNYAIITTRFSGDRAGYNYFFAKMDNNFKIISLRELLEISELVDGNGEWDPFYISYDDPLTITLSKNNTIDMLTDNNMLYSYDFNGNLLNEKEVDSSSMLDLDLYLSNNLFFQSMRIFETDEYYLIINYDKIQEILGEDLDFLNKNYYIPFK